MQPYPCRTCLGEGRIWTSRYGGNDPDVWDAGQCEVCRGTGNQRCEACGADDATERLVEHGREALLCRACWDEAVEDGVS